METVTLILPLEATAMKNPGDRSGITSGALAVATAGVTAAAADQQRSDGELITEWYRSDTRVTSEK